MSEINDFCQIVGYEHHRSGLDLKNLGWRKTKVRTLNKILIFESGGYAGLTYIKLRRQEIDSSHMNKLSSVTGLSIYCHIALYLAVPLLSASGKDGKMKKLINFEYDLWTTEDGRCMVRVRRTGEECEVDRETFRLLRAEEKRLRRERMPEKRNDIQDKVTKRR